MEFWALSVKHWQRRYSPEIQLGRRQCSPYVVSFQASSPPPRARFLFVALSTQSIFASWGRETIPRANARRRSRGTSCAEQLRTEVSGATCALLLEGSCAHGGGRKGSAPEAEAEAEALPPSLEYWNVYTLFRRDLRFLLSVMHWSDPEINHSKPKPEQCSAS